MQKITIRPVAETKKSAYSRIRENYNNREEYMDDRKIVYQIPAEYLEMIVRTDERTKTLVDTIPTLATKESVTQVKTNLEEHIENHKNNVNLWPVWASVAVALVFSVIGYFKR